MLARILSEGATPLATLFNGDVPVAVRRRILKVEIPIQRRDNWCWAAVATGIACAYGDTELTSQCKVATRIFSTENPPRQCCPSDENGGDCDVPKPLTHALRIPGHEYLDKVLGPGPQSWDFIKKEIDEKRPIGVCILRSGNQGHFLAITGYREDTIGNRVEKYIYYDDPLVSRGVRTLESFAMRSDGKWFITYTTKGKENPTVPFRVEVPADPPAQEG